MAKDQTLSLETRTTLRLSMQQLRFVKLLEYNAPELEEAVDRELEENPALDIADREILDEEETLNYKPVSRKAPADAPMIDFSPPDVGESLSDVLLRQLSEKNVDEKVNIVARYIIGNIDSNGYLQRPLPGIINDLSFNAGVEVTEEIARQALELVQSFEPYGVGASNLRECLLIQIRHLPSSEVKEDAENIILSQFDALSRKHVHKIVSGLKLNPERVKEAIDLILSLNPKPGASYSNDADRSNVIIPDAAISLDDGDISISLPNTIPDLVIDRSFAEAMKELEGVKKKNRKKGSEFIVSRYNDARDFIKLLRQRQETLMNVVSAIVKIQRDYFLTQDVYQLKPMMIKDISQLTGYDFSVVSRATNNKYLATPWGVFPLRFFFSDSIGEEGSEDATEVLTNRKIEAEIKDIVDKEDKTHPLSDEKIRLEMEKRGYDVSRRTIAKYRDRKKIPVARLRKNM